MQLPYDIVVKILEYTPIARLKRTFIGMYSYNELDSEPLNDVLQRIVAANTDPKVFFSDFIAKDDAFLYKMLITGTVLTGLRAFSYFYPISIENEKSTDEPWEFMCQSNPFSVLAFSSYLTEMGVIWSETYTERNVYAYGQLTSVNGILQTNSGPVYIQLKWATAGSKGCYFPIVWQPVSALQCIVSGHGAFDPYGKIHQKSMVRVWDGIENYNNSTNLSSPIRVMQICKQNNILPFIPKGVKYFDEYGFPLVRKRSLIDNDSLFVKFKASRCVFISPTEVKILDNYKWTEYPYGLVTDTKSKSLSTTSSKYLNMLTEKFKFTDTVYSVFYTLKGYNNSIDSIREKMYYLKPKWMEHETWNSIINMIMNDNKLVIPF